MLASDQTQGFQIPPELTFTERRRWAKHHRASRAGVGESGPGCGRSGLILALYQRRCRLAARVSRGVYPIAAQWCVVCALSSAAGSSDVLPTQAGVGAAGGVRQMVAGLTRPGQPAGLLPLEAGPAPTGGLQLTRNVMAGFDSLCQLWHGRGWA